MQAYPCARFVLAALTLTALPVAAQDTKTVEVTPYVAIGSAAASPIGTAVAFPVTSTLSVETDVAYRRGEGDRHALIHQCQSPVFPAAPGPGNTVCRGRTCGLSQYGAPVFSSSGPPIRN